MRRHLLRVELERSPEVVSALTAESMTVEEPSAEPEPANTTVSLKTDQHTRTEVLDALSPPAMTVAVNAPTAEEAVGKVQDTLSRWGEIDIQIIDQESL